MLLLLAVDSCYTKCKYFVLFMWRRFIDSFDTKGEAKIKIPKNAFRLGILYVVYKICKSLAHQTHKRHLPTEHVENSKRIEYYIGIRPKISLLIAYIAYILSPYI